MKLDRRGFIKFIVGGAVGTTLTPLPWKLIDDSAIWTQNWPWVPKLTKYPGYSYKNTVCTLCDGGCGVKVRLVNDKRTIKVEGLENAPLNKGRVCPLGASGALYQYEIARVQSPLKRLGARGSGAYTKATWPDALKEVGERLADLRKKGLAHTVVMISGRRNTMARAVTERFMEAYGSPNLIRMPSLEQSRQFAERAQFGQEDAIGYDLENSQYVLSFGCALIEGWGSPVRSIQAYSGWRASGKTKFVQIDNRASLTASKADAWVAVKPGAEAALALGIAHVLIKEDLYHKDFVGQHTEGFEPFRDAVLKNYPPAKVAEITGVPEETITALARDFAGTKQAVAISGRGKGDIPTPVYELMAVQCLNALIGNINQPGGVIVRKNIPLAEWPEPNLDQAAQDGLSKPRLDEAGTEKYPLTPSRLDAFVEAVNNGHGDPVNVLIIDEADPVFFGADPGGVLAALTKIPLVVSIASVANDSAMHSDIVLPEATNFEAPADVVNPPTVPFPVFGFGGPVLEKPYFPTQPAGDIYISLAKAVGGPVSDSIPFKSYEDLLVKNAQALYKAGSGTMAGKGILGETPEPQKFGKEKDFIKALKEGLFWYDPEFRFGDYQNAFLTPSGRFEFVSGTLRDQLQDFFQKQGEAKALEGLGVHAGGDEAFMARFEDYMPEPEGHFFPLVLIPVEQFKLVNTAIGNAPYLTKSLEDITLKGNDLVVEINPETAKRLHLSEGDAVWLSTPKGRLKVLLHLYQGAAPGYVYAPVGLGHTGFDVYLKGKGVNPLEIVVPVPDPLSGQALWWGTRANLIKV